MLGLREAGQSSFPLLRSFTLLSIGTAFLQCVPIANGFQTDESGGPGHFRATADLVLLDVSAQNSEGRYIKDLVPKNFSIFADGKGQPITYFANADSAAAIGLVVDNSGSMRTKRVGVNAAGVTFAGISNPHDEFFVINFNDRVIRGLPPSVPFTDNIQLLRSALYQANPVGQTALYDSILYALHHITYSSLERKTLIVVSDGRDTCSRLTKRELLDKIAASRTTIYTIGFADDENSDLDRRFLQKMSRVSGGQFFALRDLAGIAPTLHAISQEIRSRYTLGFTPTGVIDSRRVHELRVVARQDSTLLKTHGRRAYSSDVSENNIRERSSP
ncbi:MAG TPA: VWA domain-containing protein [Bryobacteraceae bacterium]|nr:VWA domain-containing protein [Bryobacteraceae bacterium]